MTTEKYIIKLLEVIRGLEKRLETRSDYFRDRADRYFNELLDILYPYPGEKCNEKYIGLTLKKLIGEECPDIFELYYNRKQLYFLMKNNHVVYIGQTIDQGVGNREVSHRRKNWEYDRVLYISVPKRVAREVEAYYIKKFKPKYNTHKKSNESGRSNE